MVGCWDTREATFGGIGVIVSTMGQEITTDHFHKRDFHRFEQALAAETELLEEWFSASRFHGTDPVVGFELEAWLVDGSLQPSPSNTTFLHNLDDPLVVPELASFNVEINGTPQPLNGTPFTSLAEELNQTWSKGESAAADMGLGLAMVGILPTLQPNHLNLGNMSELQRYRALNEQVMRMRGGRPLEFQIDGREHLALTHHDVMMEAGATSLQIHLQVPFHQSVDAFNAAIQLSAPMVGLCANSPYLFGHDLWSDSRIPLFEQAVNVDPIAHSMGEGRVGFGTGYAVESLFELFRENLDHYPVMLPMIQPGGVESLSNLMLHNGTIWRWNRPLVGFDLDGNPHLRIEHRVASAGPTVDDVVANSLFFVGMVMGLLNGGRQIAELMPFDQARDNFYRAAKGGMDSVIKWQSGKSIELRTLLSSELVPLAEAGFKSMELSEDEWRPWLEIIEGRVVSGQNGAVWQRRWIERNGHDMDGLLQAYMQGQRSGNPVHEWMVE